jgi:hypothetical protein
VMFSGLFKSNVQVADKELQMELTDIQCNSILKQKFCEFGLQNV